MQIINKATRRSFMLDIIKKIFESIKELFFGKSKPEIIQEPKVEAASELEVTEPVRARDEKGRFVADDPTTPENEAWVDGESPSKKKTKKTPAEKKPTTGKKRGRKPKSSV